MAVVMSGDGGWRDLDKAIAENVQRDGAPVLGWDSLRYFWRRKIPQQTANDPTAVPGMSMAKWHASKVTLIGYSFGKMRGVPPVPTWHGAWSGPPAALAVIIFDEDYNALARRILAGFERRVEPLSSAGGCGP
jgi:type IV secretory pathway VirJ component